MKGDYCRSALEVKKKETKDYLFISVSGEVFVVEKDTGYSPLGRLQRDERQRIQADRNQKSGGGICNS